GKFTRTIGQHHAAFTGEYLGKLSRTSGAALLWLHDLLLTIGIRQSQVLFAGPAADTHRHRAVLGHSEFLLVAVHIGRQEHRCTSSIGRWRYPCIDAGSDGFR